MLINLLYPYRYLLAAMIGLLTSGANYFCYLQQDIAELQTLTIKVAKKQHEKKMKLANKLNDQYALDSATHNQPFPQRYLHQRILQEMRSHLLQSGVTLRALNFIPSVNIDVPFNAVIDLQGEGHFQQITQFLLLLMNWSYPVEMLNLHLRVNEASSISFALQIMIVDKEMTSRFLSPIKTTSIHNPFCLSASKTIRKKPLLLNTVPLKQLKLLGYADYDHEKYAILQLPDGTMKSVVKERFIGKEQAKIIKIEPHCVHLLLPNQQKEFIKS